MRPSGKARIVGTPSSTARRPITTEEMTMMTPIDRSMPAVRITRVWPMPRMPVTITWVRTVEMLLAVVKRAGLTATPSSRPSTSTTKGTVVG